MRTVQIAIFLFIINMLILFVSSFGLFVDISQSGKPMTGTDDVNESWIYKNVLNLIKDLNITSIMASGLVFGFLLYVFRPMIAILLMSVVISTYMINNVVRTIVPSALSDILSIVLLLFVAIDAISYTSKGGTETGG